MQLTLNSGSEQHVSAQDYERMQQDSVASSNRMEEKEPVFTHSLRTEALVILDLGVQRFAAELARAVPARVGDAYAAVAQINLAANRLDFQEPFAPRTSQSAGFATEVLESLSKTMKSFNQFDTVLVAGSYEESVSTMRAAVNDATRELSRRFDDNLRPVFRYESESGPVERYNVAERLVTFVPIFKADEPADGQIGGHLSHSAVVCAIIACPTLLLDLENFQPRKVELIRDHIIRTLADNNTIGKDEVTFALAGSAWEMYSNQFEPAISVIHDLVTANYRGASARYVYVPRSIINSQVSVCDAVANSLHDATFEIFNALDADPTGQRGGDSPLDFLLIRLGEESADEEHVIVRAPDVDTSAKDLDFDDLDSDSDAEESDEFVEQADADDDLAEESDDGDADAEAEESYDDAGDPNGDVPDDVAPVIAGISEKLQALVEAGTDLEASYKQVREILRGTSLPVDSPFLSDWAYVIDVLKAVLAAKTRSEYVSALAAMLDVLADLNQEDEDGDADSVLLDAVADALEPYVESLADDLASVNSGTIKGVLKAVLEKNPEESDTETAALVSEVIAAKTRSAYNEALDALLDAAFSDEEAEDGEDEDDEDEEAEDGDDEEGAEFELNPDSMAYAFGAVIGYLDLATPQLEDGEELSEQDAGDYAEMREEAIGELRTLISSYDGDEEFNRAILMLDESLTQEMLDGASGSAAALSLFVKHLDACLENTDLFDYAAICGSNVLAGYDSMMNDDEDEDAEEGDE